jgi:cob(I)alamin adenosyltransferase
VKIYTKRGDSGKTDLFGMAKKINKSSIRVSAYGEIDELNSVIGLIRATLTTNKSKNKNPTLKKNYKNIEKVLEKIQNDLFIIGADLATPKINKKHNKLSKIKKIGTKDINKIEKTIDDCSKNLEPLKNFILPGGSILASLFHISRTICRRAERTTVELNEKEDINKNIIPYLNRLSDLLFVFARISNKLLKIKDIKWK